MARGIISSGTVAVALALLGLALVVRGTMELCFGLNVAFPSRRIGRGQLDHMLLMPQPLWTTIACDGFCPASGSGQVLAGTAVLTWAVRALELPVGGIWIAGLLVQVVSAAGIMLAFAYLWASLAFVAPRLAFGLVPIALISALPILLGSPKRLRLVRGIDWTTLVFFASMFVLMRSVWETEWFRPLAAGREGLFASTPVILSGSILMSQVLSNVPLVALVLPVLIQSQAPVKAFVALAAGSTLAGNLFILGAASNVIIIEGAERRTGATLTFMDFARAGLPLTFLTGLVYWIWLDGF